MLKRHVQQHQKKADASNAAEQHQPTPSPPQTASPSMSDFASYPPSSLSASMLSKDDRGVELLQSLSQAPSPSTTANLYRSLPFPAQQMSQAPTWLNPPMGNDHQSLNIPTTNAYMPTDLRPLNTAPQNPWETQTYANLFDQANLGGPPSSQFSADSPALFDTTLWDPASSWDPSANSLFDFSSLFQAETEPSICPPFDMPLMDISLSPVRTDSRAVLWIQLMVPFAQAEKLMNTWPTRPSRRRHPSASIHSVATLSDLQSGSSGVRIVEPSTAQRMYRHLESGGINFRKPMPSCELLSNLIELYFEHWHPIWFVPSFRSCRGNVA